LHQLLYPHSSPLMEASNYQGFSGSALKHFFCDAMLFELRQLPWHVGHAKYPTTRSDHPDPYYPIWQFQLLSDNTQRIPHPSHPSDKPIYKVRAILRLQVYPR
jgi:hypothetical protein